MAATGDKRLQRRLAAILAADVAGYSRLMGVDESGTLGALQAPSFQTDHSGHWKAPGSCREAHGRRHLGRVR